MEWLDDMYVGRWRITLTALRIVSVTLVPLMWWV
jgi:hypothetical protein